MSKIYGITHKHGTFEGHNYDNFTLFYPIEIPETVGTAFYGLKVKSTVMAAALSQLGYKSVNDLVGKELHHVYYDQYRNVEALDIK